MTRVGTRRGPFSCARPAFLGADHPIFGHRHEPPTSINPFRDSVSRGQKYLHRKASDNYTLGSAHQGSMNAVFADGSVRSIRYSISWSLLNQLADRRDGSVIDLTQVE